MLDHQHSFLLGVKKIAFLKKLLGHLWIFADRHHFAKCFQLFYQRAPAFFKT